MMEFKLMKIKKSGLLGIASVALLLIAVLILAVSEKVDWSSNTNLRMQSANDPAEKKNPVVHILSTSDESSIADQPKINKYNIVAMKGGVLKIDQSLVKERVDCGLGRLTRGIKTEPKSILSMSSAYEYLMGNEIFMDDHIPEFGIETDDYYVFSGYRGTKSTKAFLQGCSVRKSDGRISKWWPQEESDESDK